MDTDVGEKTMTSSTVLPGGDEEVSGWVGVASVHCQCVCILICVLLHTFVPRCMIV